jgi:hypothetical protein
MKLTRKQKSIIIEKQRKKKYILLLIGLLVLLFFGMPDSVLYAKTGILRWSPFVLIFTVLPLLVYLSVQDLFVNKQIVKIIALVSVFIIGPGFGIWTGKLADKDLNENGIIIKGSVTEKWYSHKKNTITGEWLYKARFNTNNKTYFTFSNVDDNNTLNVGDPIMIKYSRRNPENNTIMDEK